jgi:hypothetical protein
MAIAIGLVAITTADRTNTLTTFLAHNLHGKQQQNLLGDYLLKLDSLSFVKSDFRFTLVDLDLLLHLARELAGRTVKKINRGVNGDLHFPQAAVAFPGDLGSHPALDPHFPAGVRQKLGLALREQRFHLFQTLAGKLNLTGLEGLFKTDPPYFQFPDAEEHTILTRILEYNKGPGGALIGKALNKCPIQRCDELDAGHNLAAQPVAVCYEQVTARVGPQANRTASGAFSEGPLEAGIGAGRASGLAA